MRMTRALVGCAVLVMLAGSAGFAAEPVKGPPLSPLSVVQTFRGDVEMRTSGQTVVVTLRDADGDHLFRVETSLLTGLPQIRSTGADILFWQGHLVVKAPNDGKAWHFSVPGLDRSRRPGKELDAQLRATYELTRIDTASAIISRSGPGALSEPLLRGVFANMDTEYQDPGSGGGVGSCGLTCTITCGDGSSCSASCVANRCASCSCPATCTCR